MKRVLTCLAAAAGIAAGSAQAALMFTDWTSMNTVAEAASGTLGFTTVFLTAADISDGTIDGTFTGFSSAAFSPPTATSDGLILVGRPIHQLNFHSVTFGEAVLNPIIHLHSLASDLRFFDDITRIPISSISKVSGDAGLTVSGDQVRGVAFGSTDSNGTIQLNGSFTSFGFSTFYSGREEFYFQVGATQIQPAPPPDPPPPPPPPPQGAVPEPSSIALALGALAMLGASRRRSRQERQAQSLTQST